MKVVAFSIFLCFYFIQVAAQTTQDPEFPKEFIMHLKLHNGMVTNFTKAPDIYAGGLQLIPQYTIVPQKIRAGVILDGYYTSKKLSAAFGPTVSFKLKTFKANPFGSLGNIHLNLDHLWGSGKEWLIGGGINADIANKIVLGLMLHRDYNLNTWWIQSTVGIRISTLKKPVEIFNQ